MNAPHSVKQLTAPQVVHYAPAQEDDDINLLEYWDIVVDNRWLIAGITALTLLAGAAYAFLAKPVYETNLLIQVEDSGTSAQGLLGEAANLFEVKTAASAEIEILRSRMVIGQAVDQTRFYIDAQPNYLPVIGNWLAQRAKGLSDPGIIGYGGWVSGTESIEVAAFDPPAALEGTVFVVAAGEGGAFTVRHDELAQEITGKVGNALTAPTPFGPLSLTVSRLEAKPGAEFTVVRASRLKTIEYLQKNLKLTEMGRQSGVIDATLQDSDRERLTLVLNEIGMQYVRQNVERKAAEAQKTLKFLDMQLPQFKKQLEASEEAYNRYRNQKGTVALDEEAKLILGRSVDLQAKLVDAQQKRVELLSRFTQEHPSVKTLDAQIAGWNREIAELNSRVKRLPSVQQDAIRLERDVKVNNELYQQLRNNALQLQLIREGKIGNVRVIDNATTPEQAVKPRRGMTLALALALGLIGGALLAFARNAFFRGIRGPGEIEAQTGLPVYGTIPLSAGQIAMQKRVAAKLNGMHALAQVLPDDAAIESLRSLRTAMQFIMLDTSNNLLVVTGATPGVGKSFVSVNFSAVLASAGKRVLLIDADLRRGHLNQYFGVGRGPGLSELIAQTTTAKDAIHKDLLPNLDVIATGTLPPNPAELVMSRAFVDLVDQFSKQYDVVIIDTAPVLVAADTLSIALLAGTRILVARAGETQIGELNESAKRLKQVGAPVTGVLLNALDLTRRQYGSYGGYNYKQYRYGTT